MATTPKYTSGDVAYLKESAALGFLEPIRIRTVTLGPFGWMYGMAVSNNPAAPGGPYDRRSLVNTQVLLFREDELVLLCDALVLAEANAKQRYQDIVARRQSLCPNSPTEVG